MRGLQCSRISADLGQGAAAARLFAVVPCLNGGLSHPSLVTGLLVQRYVAGLEQDVLAAILLEEIASERRWSQSFAKSERVLESLASEALAEFRAGKTEPLDDL